MDANQDKLLSILLSEYAQLKDEQKSRVGFRDNLLYVTLTVYGGLAAFALSDPSYYLTFLVMPWICIILGWTYLVNDEKISAIGRYIRLTVVAKVKGLYGGNNDEFIFGWEVAHRSDTRRKSRKKLQLLIDLLTFVAPGTLSLIAYALFVDQPHWLVIIVGVVELILLIFLGVEIIRYADLASGN